MFRKVTTLFSGFFLAVTLVFPLQSFAGWARTYTSAGSEVSGLIWPAPSGANNYSLWGALSSTATPPAFVDKALSARLSATGAIIANTGKTVTMAGKHSLFIYEQTDGSFFVSGIKDTSATSTPANNIVWAKYNSNWTPAYAPKMLGGSRNDRAYFSPTADGGYIAIGSTDSYGAAGDSDIMLVKITSAGAVQWSKAIHHGADDQANMIIELTGGGYAVAAEVQSSTGTDLVLMKLTAGGAIAWKKKISKAGVNTVSNIFQANNGDIILMGNGKADVYSMSSNLLLFRFTAAGALVFKKSYGNNADMVMGSNLIENADGTFILSGAVQGIDFATYTFTSKLLLMKLTAAGAISAQKTLTTGNSDTGVVSRMSNGSLLLSGGSTVMSASSVNMNILYGRINPSTLAAVWARTFSGNGMETGMVMENSTGTGFFLTGITDSYPYSASAPVIKTFGITLDANGNYASCPPIKPAVLTAGTASILATNALHTVTVPTLVLRTPGPAAATTMTVAPATLTTGPISTCPVTQ